ncbi:hypothetical protein OAN96_01305 [Candidatus Gracilibacteria bacterium]|nr:hypothetical protein [Candidatus Gracilibacteria bacterium]
MSFKNEKIVETKSCQKCQVSFDITDKDSEFYDKVSPVFNGEKFQIPAPKLCPDCREQRRLSFRNERHLYSRKCDFSGEDIVSVFSPDKEHKIYKNNYWWGDEWDPYKFGVEFDFSNNFFVQYNQLFKQTPHISILNDNGINSENSEYCFNFSYGKNAYLVHTAWHVENSMYCRFGGDFKNCYDTILAWNSEHLYECSSVGDSYNCSYLMDSVNCKNCHFGLDLHGCSDCYFSIGLNNKQYCIFNKQYTKEQYHQMVNHFKSHETHHDLKNKFQELLKTHPIKGTYNSNSQNCVGDRLLNSKNMYYCFNIFNGEDCKYYFGGADSPKDSCDISIGGKHELGYESIVPDYSYKTCFTNLCFNSQNLYYCDNCHDSQYLFGCIGLRNKQYCVLNKQYTKEEYEQLIPKIITKMQQDGDWGEFFPSELSPFGYNETVANECFPLAQKQAKQQGFNWSEYEAPFPKVEKTIPANKLPDNIKQIPDDILNWAIKCEVTNKLFRVTSQELKFYRKHDLPVPHRHPDQRHLDRMNLRNPRKLFERSCGKCGVDLQSSYAPDRLETVYCENCYNTELY